jgi:hypothetical protein
MRCTTAEHPTGWPSFLKLKKTGFKKLFYLNIFAVVLHLPLAAQGATEVPLYGVYEVTLTSTSSHSNPYTDVTLSGTFQGPTQTITLPGFWDGGGTWKIRMAPTEVGTWTLTDVVSNDSQLNNQQEGTSFLARQPTSAEIANNEVLRHGFVRVSKSYPHRFEHADGTPFFLMGDTQWERAILSSDGLTYTGSQLFQSYQFEHPDSRVSKGFNVATMAHFGLTSPELPNEGGTAFVGGHINEVLNPAFFQAADFRVAYMTAKGIRPMIVIGSPDHGLTSNTTWLGRFATYLVARYAAYDVIWFGVKEYQEWGSTATAAINAIGNAYKNNDPYNHPRSTHTLQETGGLDSSGWLTFHAIQGRGFDPLSLYSFGKPVVQAEAFYENDPGSPHSSTSADLLGSVGIWRLYMRGAFEAGYQFNGNGDPAVIMANMNTTQIQYHQHFRDFFVRNTEFQKLVPHNDLRVSGTAEVMAQEINENGVVTGQEYVAYLVNGGSVTLDLSHASGTLEAKWYDPRTGLFTGQTTAAGGGNSTFNAPDSSAWVLHIANTNSNGSRPLPPTSLVVQ